MKTRLVKQVILFQLFHILASGDEKLESDHPYPFDHTNQDYTHPAGMLNLGLGYIFDHSFGSNAYSVLLPVRWIFLAKILEYWTLVPDMADVGFRIDFSLPEKNLPNAIKQFPNKLSMLLGL